MRHDLGDHMKFKIDFFSCRGQYILEMLDDFFHMEKLIFPSAEVNCNFNLLLLDKKILEETEK